MKQIPICDSHVHSNCSFDAQDSVDAICAQAEKLGLYAVTFTDHCEVPMYKNPDRSEFGDFKTLLPQAVRQVRDAQKQYKGRLRIYCGIELGEPLQDLAAAQQALALTDYDFVLCSLHNIQGERDFYWLSYDRNTVHDILTRYFNELLCSVQWNGFDSLAHLTYPLRYIKKNGKINVDLNDYSAQIDAILRTLIKNGKALEVNTSGLRQEIGQTLPGENVLRRFKELGGRYVTVGSDAHRCKDLAKGIKEGYALLKKCGFTHYTVYEKHTPVEIAL